MMTDALIKAGRADTSCARACYVGRWYSSAFVVASVFVVAPDFIDKTVRCSTNHCITIWFKSCKIYTNVCHISLNIFFCIRQTRVVKTGSCPCERHEEGALECGGITPHIRKL